MYSATGYKLRVERVLVNRTNHYEANQSTSAFQHKSNIEMRFYLCFVRLFLLKLNKRVFPVTTSKACFANFFLPFLSKCCSDDRNLASSVYPSKWFWQVSQADTQQRWPQHWPHPDEHCRLAQLWQGRISILQKSLCMKLLMNCCDKKFCSCWLSGFKKQFVSFAYEVLYFTCKGQRAVKTKWNIFVNVWFSPFR